MKKTTLSIFAAVLLSAAGLKAQTVQEGINHLYADRFKSAAIVFDKLLAVNPNNIDAIYWKGQTILQSDEIMAARLSEAKRLYEKALQTTNSAPLIQVGMGHVELLEEKMNEARQHFETALTLTRKTKTGDDPIIETAIGRGIVDSKNGDFAYAVRLLEDASAKDAKNPDVFLNLGNAYRKAGQGSGGGKAFESYNKALQLNPSFAIASLRLAKLFESQKNWEFVLNYLNESVTKDPNFTAGYYELFYYYFYRAKFPEAEAQLNKYINSKGNDSEIQDQYLYAQLCYVKKDYDCAVSKGESVVSAMGDKTKPKLYRLLAYAYFDKGDFTNAKRSSDMFFAKKNPEDPIPPDYTLRADILSKTGGTDEELIDAFTKASDLDTILTSKIETLKKAAGIFKGQKKRDIEAMFDQKVIELKKDKASINDYFELTTAYYFSQNYAKSRDAAMVMRERWPEQVFGFEWSVNNAQLLDSAKKDSIYVPDLLKMETFASADTVKFRKQYMNAIKPLGAYYYNTRNKDKAVEYFQKWKVMEPANPQIDTYLKAAEGLTPKPPATPTPPGTKPGTQKAPATNKPPAKTTTGSKPAATTKPKTNTKTVAKN